MGLDQIQGLINAIHDAQRGAEQEGLTLDMVEHPVSLKVLVGLVNHIESLQLDLAQMKMRELEHTQKIGALQAHINNYSVQVKKVRGHLQQALNRVDSTEARGMQPPPIRRELVVKPE